MKVEILISDITKLTTRTKYEAGLVTTIQFDVKIQPALIARLLNLQRQGAPLYASIGSSQAVMDVTFQEYHSKPEEDKTTQVDLFNLQQEGGEA